MNQPSILITGVAGLLGSRLADWLLEHTDYHVVGIDNLSGGYRENVHTDVIFYKQDINEGTQAIFAQHKPAYVFHFAAYAAEGLSPFIRRFNYENNVLATAEIINQCINHDVKRLVFTSSMAVYGAGQPPFDEADQPKPIDPYGVAKYACEMDITIAGEQHGLDWCIIRPHNVYGNKQNIWDKYRNVLGIWIYQHLNDKALTIYGDGLQQRAFSFIDDCLASLWNAATCPDVSKQIINLGGIHETTIDAAADTLIDVMGGGKKVFLEARHEVKYAYPTYQKSVELLGYKDTTTLKDGLTTMWAWAKRQRMRSQKQWSSYEVEKGLYSYWSSTDAKEVVQSV